MWYETTPTIEHHRGYDGLRYRGKSRTRLGVGYIYAENMIANVVGRVYDDE